MPNQRVHPQAGMTPATHTCPMCWGSGVITNPGPPTPCFMCGERGYLPRLQKPWPVETLEQELKCRRCGECCYIKITLAGKVFYTRYRCPFLDVATRLCKVYNRRYILGPNCVPADVGVKMGIMPVTCAYIKDVAGYQGPVQVASLDDIENAVERELKI